VILTVIPGDPHDARDRTPDRTRETPGRELTDEVANRVTAALAKQGIVVRPVVDIFHTVHLWAAEPLPTRQEVRAVAAFHRVTDCRLAFHQAVA
jgi:hypothetical protein